MIEIDPKDADQVKERQVVKYIDGRDKQEYTITKDHPLITGDKDGKGKDLLRAKVGDKHWAHPEQVAIWIKRGWVEKTDSEIIKHKMPAVDKR